MNYERLAQVVAAIDANPDSFCSRFKHSYDGTVHSMAGHAEMLSRGETTRSSQHISNTSLYAMEFLDLSCTEAMYLFHPYRTIEDFRFAPGAKFSASGFDSEGYDAGGYDAGGCDRKGYDAGGCEVVVAGASA